LLQNNAKTSRIKKGASFMTKIRLALVEDNRILRERVVLMMKKQKNVEVVLASGNCEQVLSKAQKFKSVIVVIESGHPNMIPMLESLKLMPEVRVIVTGVIALQADIFELVRRGVSGFVLKEATFSHLLRTIRLVARGAKVLPRAMTGSLFSQIIEDRTVHDSLPPMDGRTTAREREIISLIREGMSNKEISQRLHIATYTVKSHVHNVLEKLALRNRVQLLAYADQATPLKANSNNGSRMI
jgi:DNA-binding NarL/FixJ family response regulator